MTDAFYEPLGEGRFRSTLATTGPWDRRWQHGGPPAALVVHALDKLDSRSRQRIARVTVDILRPVPVAALEVRTQVVHAGRQVELLAGSLHAQGQEVLRVSAWRIAVSADSVPAVAERVAPPALPARETPVAWPGARTEGLISSVEWRFVSGEPGIPGPAQVWARVRPALVAGEDITGLERALILADSGHGLSGELDPRQWLFINTDVTVAVHRHPEGEWICLEAGTVIDPAGTGMTATFLSDRHGRIGRCLQTLLVARRR